MSTDLELAGQAAQEVVAAVTGTAPGRQALEWAADVIRGRRARTQIKVLVKTQRTLDEAGLSPHVVPDKTLVPLLEWAGLEPEDDESMLDRWTALLANAATNAGIPPGYPEILRQLESAEAQALDELVPDDRAVGRGVSVYGLNLVGRQVDNLERLGLLRSVPAGLTENDLNQLVRGGSQPTKPDLVVTMLGASFVLACRRPSPLVAPGQDRPPET